MTIRNLSIEGTPYRGYHIANLAGIIPVTNYKNKMKLPYHDFLLPVKEGLTAIENAVNTCAIAGCRSIWVVCDDDIVPMVRKLVGEYIGYLDRVIPIFYVPCNPKDYMKRDSYAYSIVQGAKTASTVSRAYSVWTVPNKYFIMFPMTIVDQKQILARKMGEDYHMPFVNTLFCDNEKKTILDNKAMPFVTTAHQMTEVSYCIVKSSMARSILEPGKKWDLNDPTRKIKRTNQARSFTYEQAFAPLTWNMNNIRDIATADISTWEKYQDFFKNSGERLIYIDKSMKTTVDVNKMADEDDDVDFIGEIEKVRRGL